RDAARDDAVGAEHADAEIGDVHRTALAFAVAGLPTVELGHHPVEIGALGDAVAMAAMRRDDPVALAERGAGADGDGRLADIAMHDAVDLAGEIIGRGALLEAADRQHPAQHLALLLGRQVRRKALHGREAHGAWSLRPVGAFNDAPAPAGRQPERNGHDRCSDARGSVSIVKLTANIFMRMFWRPRGFLGRCGRTIMARTNSGCAAWVTQLLNIKSDENVLEVGFGPGAAIEQLSKLAGHVTGVDPSPEMMEQARARNVDAIDSGQVELQLGCADSLPFKNDTF